MLAGLLTDMVSRVRGAAARAVAVVGEAEHAPPPRRLLTDADLQVRARPPQAPDVKLTADLGC